jgi:hypothetical protein
VGEEVVVEEERREETLVRGAWVGLLHYRLMEGGEEEETSEMEMAWEESLMIVGVAVAMVVSSVGRNCLRPRNSGGFPFHHQASHHHEHPDRSLQICSGFQ